MNTLVTGGILLTVALSPSVGQLPATETENDAQRPVAHAVDTMLKNVSDAVKRNAERGAESLKGASEQGASKLPRVSERTNDKSNAAAPEVKDAKLSGDRLARCQTRQANINRLIDESVTVSQTQFNKIEGVESALRSFAAKQSIKSSEYELRGQSVVSAKSVASSSIKTASEWNFSCNVANAAYPSVDIRRMNSDRQIAMSDYRESVKSLASYVKGEFEKRR